MKNFKNLFFAFTILFSANISAQEKSIDITSDFDKIIVSPHISVDFVQGNKASVVVNNISVPIEKFNYEIKGKTLKVYLEGAKSTTKHEKVYHDGWKQKVPIYKNNVAHVTITYVNVDTFSIRGEENIAFNSPIQQEDLTLRIYGESEVKINEVDLQDFRVTIYGASEIDIDKGTIQKQRYKAYGESIVNAENVESNDTKVTVYGDGTFHFNVNNRLKVTSYGEADVLYKGDPEVRKGIILGEAKISRKSR